jgi:hypothetical protein
MSRWEWALLAATVAASLAIVGSSTYLPMNDAPSHLGTAFIAFELLKGDPFFAAHYRFLPIPLPYWAATLLQLPLIPIFGALAAFAIVVGLYVVLLPLSFYVLVRTAAPENARLTPVVALAAFNWSYWLGEVNYFMGLPCVLFALAFFLRIPNGGGRARAGFLAAALAAYACHIYALTILLVGVCSLAALSLAGLAYAPLSRWRFTRAQWVTAAVLALPFAAGAYFVLVFRGGTMILARDRPHYGLIFDLSPRKLVHIATQPFESPTLPSSWPALAFVAVVLAVLLFSIRRPAPDDPRARGSILDALNPPLLFAAVAMLGLYYLGPVATVREGEIGKRFLLPGFFLLLGAVRFRPTRIGRTVLALAVVSFGVFKLADAWRLHRGYDAVATGVSRNLLSQIPEGSRVVPIRDPSAHSSIADLYHRLANYVVVERHSYSANIMATAGQQAIQHLRPHVAGASGHRRQSQRSPSYRVLDELDWQYYDYVLVQSDLPQPDVPQLEARASLVGREDGFRLYRVDHPTSAAAEAH